MGRLKQLLPLGDRPVLRHTIDSLRQAGVTEMVVVCGADAEKYETALADSGAQEDAEGTAGQAETDKTEE